MPSILHCNKRKPAEQNQQSDNGNFAVGKQGFQSGYGRDHAVAASDLPLL
ncbi:hypothetical protein SH528x_002951 [Novipirellula sp. SH528]